MKLQGKIFLLFVSIATLLGGPLLWTVRQSVRKIDLEDVAQKGQVKVLDLVDRIARDFPSQNEILLLPFLQAAQDQSGALYVVALGMDGRVLAHTNVVEKGKIYSDVNTQADLRLNSPDGHAASYRGSLIMEVAAPVWSRTAAASPEDFLLSGEKESAQKERLGVVRLGLPLDQVFQREFRLFHRIAVIIFVTGGVAILLVFILMRRMLRPIGLLSHGTSQISRGKYGVQVPVLSKDELGHLAADFNRMSKVLNETTVSKDFLGDILSNMIDPLIVLAADMTIRMANPATLNLLGYEKNELERQPAHILFLDTHKLPEGLEHETLIGRKSIRNLELEFRTKEGTKIPVLFSSSILHDAEGQFSGIIATAKDMSERKRLEGAIRQSEKMSAVGQLAAGVAHEINNPLGVILGFAQASLRRLTPGEPLEMPLKSIEKEALRCKDLIQDLLTFSRVSKVGREPMDLNKTIEGALTLVTARARASQVEVRRELADHLPRILGNPNQIQQAIVNLANNAFDAMGAGGGIFTVKTESLTEGPLSWICLRVTDSGSGIVPEVLPRIFEPFFTTKPVGKGTGLGLSLIHEMIKKHSGTIDVQSRPGCTEFQIKFPVRLSPGSVPQDPLGKMA